MKEYAIKHCKYFIQEGNTEGEYYRVKDIKQASTFPTLQNASKFVEDDMGLNIACVELVELETIIIQRPMFIHNGVWYDKREYGRCENCNGVHKRDDLEFYKAPQSDIELLCTECIEFAERYASNEFDPTSDLAKEWEGQAR